ncbi:WYL domain-containing protein [Lederbergia sp. NSJ-179]|nr:WYL domain-containing protein [Lederbergia sp. NSJ-179]
MLQFLKRACESDTPIEIIYMDRNNQISQRTIKVLSISTTSMKAYCYTKRQFRTFKIGNILSTGPIRRGA